MRRGLVFVLSAIVLLNVVAIVVLQNRVVEERQQLQEPIVQAPAPVPEQPLPIVGALILEDTSRCPDCYDIRSYATELEGVLNLSVTQGDPTPFSLDILPAIAFSDAVEAYPDSFTDGWEAWGDIVTIPSGEQEGTWYVLQTLNPPYLDVASGEVRGRVSVTYLTMDSCSECYDVTLNDEFMLASRITPYAEQYLDADSTEGQRLIQQYEITALPTIIMSADASEYSNLQPGWPLVGTIEEDGSYVLRDLQRLKVVYYDLEFDRLMEP